MAQFVGDSNGKARQIYNMYVGDANGKARKIKKAYVGDANGKARLFYENAVRQNSSDIYGMYIFGGQCTDEVGEATYCYPFGYDNSSTELTAGVVYRFMLDPRDYYSKPERFSYYAPDGSGGMDWVYKEVTDDGNNITYKGALPFGTTMFGFANSGTVSADTVTIQVLCSAPAGVYQVETYDNGEPWIEYAEGYATYGFPLYDELQCVARLEEFESASCTLEVGKWYAIVTDYGWTSVGMFNIHRSSDYTHSDEGEYITDDYMQSASLFQATADLMSVDAYSK